MDATPLLIDIYIVGGCILQFCATQNATLCKDMLQLCYMCSTLQINCECASCCRNSAKVFRLFVVTFGCLIRITENMSVLAITGLVGGLASAAYGAYKQSRAAKETEAKLAEQKAAKEAWYNRNYYQDYLNTVGAQNAIKRVKDAWAERTREARARQAITGGTPEQTMAVMEAGGEAMGDTVANLAAQGEARKDSIDAQKLAMDNNIAQQEIAIAEQKQQAGANIMHNGANLITSSLQAFDVKAPKAGATTTTAGETVTPEAVTTSVNTPGVIGKEAGMNPGLVVPEDNYYSKNKKYY